MSVLERSVRETALAVVDVETTGLWAEQGDRVCEIAVLRFEQGQRVDTLATLVNPGRPIHPDASYVNGLDDEAVAGAPPFGALADHVDRLLADAVLVAHNAPFDGAFLVAEYAILGREPPDVPVIDTLALARRHFRFRRNDLASIAQAFGTPIADLHRAEADADTTFRVFDRMLDVLADKGLHTVRDIVAAQGDACPLRQPRLEDLPGPLDDALRKRRPITICYVDAGGRASERVVEPLWANRHYLIAYCRRRKQQRTFRLDRIVDAWLS